MARRFVRRDRFNKIMSSTAWPNANNPEEIDDQSAEFVAYLDAENTPPPPLPCQAPPIPSGNSIPALRDEVAALRQVLIDAGLLDA